ncbi:MAG: ABC transporter permease [Rhodanobacteraceae bacterium]|nr:ABC transporter permease [Rhodanobacteraceae bacterium]
MIRSYITAGLRALLRHRMHFALNVCGLAIGLAATLLVTAYVQFELSFDRFQPNLASTYRLAQVHNDAGEITGGLTATNRISLTGQQIAKTMPEVKSLFSLFPLSRGAGIQIEVDGAHLRLNNLYAATPNIRDFVKLDVIAGDLDAALASPGKIALSRSEAIRLLGEPAPIGKPIKYRNGAMTVTAVFEDLPNNTHYDFTSLAYVNPNRNPDEFWGNTYVELAQDSDIAALAARIRTQINARSPQPWNVGLLPVKDIHIKTGNNEQTIAICIALSLLLLGIASFNFINMSTAQAAQRAKEVGVRKALGASKSQLVTQFLVESVLVATIAAVMAAVIVQFSLPWFADIVGSKIQVNYLGVMGLDLIAITLVVGVLAGLYPALFVSAFSAKRVLSGDLQRGTTAIAVRKTLLVVQSIFSVCLIIATIVVFQQIRYLSDLPVGYAKTSRLEIRGLNPDVIFDQKNSGVVDELKRIDGVVNAAPFDRSLTEGSGGVLDIIYPHSPDTKNAAGFSATGYGFIETVGLKLVAGRDFSPAYGDWHHKTEQGLETASIIITESMVRSAGIATPEEAVGQVFRLGIDGRTDVFNVTVVGVVADIKMGSVKVKQYPLFFICGYSWSPESTLVLQIADADIGRVRGEATAIVKKHLGVENADIRLVEDNYDAIYRYEHRQAELVLVFSVLAIFLTCIGLFGLAAYSTQRRSKEVAIRKVLGASRMALVNLLAGEYLLLVGFSSVAAFPIAFFFTSEWLSNFNERIGQSPLVYLAAAILILVIAWATVSVLALRAASLRPSLTLRHD